MGGEGVGAPGEDARPVGSGGERSTSDPLVGALRRGALGALVISDLRGGRRPAPAAFAELGLSAVRPYVVAVAEADPSGDLERQLLRSGAVDGLPVVQAVIDRWSFALVPGEVDPGDHPGPIARSARVPLTLAATAFAEAEQALATAQAFGVDGLVDLDGLAPLSLVTATTVLASTAASTRFARLDALGPAGVEIEASVAALLTHDGSIDATASSLGVHRNTVRARRRRFQELTGLDVARTTDLVTAWWLLSWRRAERGR